MRKHKTPGEAVTRIKLNRNNKKINTRKNTAQTFQRNRNIHSMDRKINKKFNYKNSKKRKTLNKIFKRFDKSGYEPDDEGIERGPKRM